MLTRLCFWVGLRCHIPVPSILTSVWLLYGLDGWAKPWHGQKQSNMKVQRWSTQCLARVSLQLILISWLASSGPSYRETCLSGCTNLEWRWHSVQSFQSQTSFIWNVCLQGYRGLWITYRWTNQFEQLDTWRSTMAELPVQWWPVIGSLHCRSSNFVLIKQGAHLMHLKCVRTVTRWWFCWL